MSSAEVARLRHKLLAQPGITPLPVCPWCGKQVPAKAWGHEACRVCELDRAAVSEAWEAERWAEANPGASFPVPAEPMFGSDDAAKPFLPDDEDYWTEQQRLAEDRIAHEAAEEWDRNEVAEHAANEPTEGEEGPF